MKLTEPRRLGVPEPILGSPHGGPIWRLAGAHAALFALSAPAALQAQTLTQALADAYNTNPQLLAQRALLRATDEQVPQALANWRPTVNFTGQMGGTRSAFVTPSQSVVTRWRASHLFDLLFEQPQSPGNPADLHRRSDRGADQSGDQPRRIGAGADPGGRDHGIPGRRHGLSRRRARPGPACRSTATTSRSCASSSRRPRTVFGSAK